MIAEDFIYAFKRIADYHINTGLAWAFLAGRIQGLDEFREKTRQFKVGDFSRYDLPISGMRAPDRYTIELRLTAPFPQLIYVLCMNVYAPIPHETVDYWLGTRADESGARISIPYHERSPELLDEKTEVGTGPYVLKTWKRKWKFILTKNPWFRDQYYPSEGEPASEQYIGDSAAGLLKDAGKRVPFIDEVQFQYIEETYPSWMLFLTKQVDVAGIPRETFKEIITPDKELSEKWKKQHIYLKRFSEPTIYWLVFNNEDPVLGTSKSLRQAICLGYDVENEIQILLNGRGKRALNMIPTDFKGHKEAGPGPYARYNPSEAREKIKLAKLELERAGKLENGNLPVLTLDLSDGVFALRTADFARQQFANIGLQIKVVHNDWPTLQRKVNNKQAQMYMMGWSADYPDAENFLQLFYSGNIDKGTNNANFKNTIFDSLYEKVREMQDSEQRTEIYARMAKILSEECPVMPAYEPELFTLFNDWVENVKPHPIGYGYTRYRRINETLRKEHGGKS